MSDVKVRTVQRIEGIPGTYLSGTLHSVTCCLNFCADRPSTHHWNSAGRFCSTACVSLSGPLFRSASPSSSAPATLYPTAEA